VTNEFFLVCNKMLTFIDRKLLCVIKQVHNQFMGGLDITMIGNLYKLHHFKIHGFSNLNLVV
jgi:hypothetical protein